MNNVKDFGALGNGIDSDTQAIQKALDAGGIVYFPAGIYISGTIYLRSNGGIKLAAGAVLKGSFDPKEYCTPDFCAQNSYCEAEKAYGGHLIVALEVHHVSISGFGRIDGNREAFFDPDTTSRDNFNGWRPSQMLFFCESSDIRICELELSNAPYWSCFLHGCKDVFIHGVKITSHPHAWNADGIDIDCCRRVIVSDCNIQSADDSITIRAADVKCLLHSDGICEHIVVSNCILSSSQAAVRIGVGNGEIRNCTFKNLNIIKSAFGICMQSTYLPNVFPEGAEGVAISDILFDTIVMSDTAIPIDISSNWADCPLEKSAKKIQSVTIRNVRAYCNCSCIIQGNLDRNISDIFISGVSLTYSGGEFITKEENRDGFSVYLRPCAFYVAHAESVRFENLVITWQNESENWQQALYTKDAPQLTLRDCRLQSPCKGVALMVDNTVIKTNYEINYN